MQPAGGEVSNLPFLLNWPPEKPYEMLEYQERKFYGFGKFLILAGVAIYFYVKFHGQ